MSHISPKTRVCRGRPERAEIYRNDVSITYSAGEMGEHDRGERTEITMLTTASLRRLCFVAHNTSVMFDTMTTLTYPGQFESDGKRVKYHLDRWLKWARRTCGIEAYLWALEFQRRGAPHFHVFTAGGCLVRSKAACSTEWYFIVDSGDERHLRAGTRVERLRKPDAAGRYAAKYASKPYQKAVPPDYRNVGRFWGHSRNVKPEPFVSRRLEGWGDLIREFEGWEYHHKLINRKPLATLYNASGFLREKYGDQNHDR